MDNRSTCWSLTRRSLATLILLGCCLAAPAVAQQESAETSFEWDLLLAGGHVMDVHNGIDGLYDVAIADSQIVAVGEGLDPASAERVVDVSGLYVMPGLIDLHVHVFWGTGTGYARGRSGWSSYSDSYNAVRPDDHAPRAGVTTVVDAGSSGWRNFPTFYDRVIKGSRTRVLAFLNIVGAGMNGGPAEQDLTDMDGRLTGQMAERFDSIVGVKLAHFRGPDWEPTRRAVAAGEAAEVPVMVDFGGSKPPLPFTQLLQELRPGGILTHCYAGVGSRESIVDLDEGKLRDVALKARERGVLFDVGHGGGSFRFDVALPALRAGFFPNTISTDLHIGSMNAGMKDMANVMSKFLAMGMSWSDVVAASTLVPAQTIQREDLGHLSVGAVADIAVFSLREGQFGYVDVRGKRLSGTQRAVAELTIRAGRVLWDLNGLTAEPAE